METKKEQFRLTSAGTLLLSRHADAGVFPLCRRLGNGRFGMDPLLNHPWFRGIDWDKLEKHQIKAPFIPKILAEDDIRNFDEVNGTQYAMHRRIQPVDDKML
jgi:hypothetical protein